MSCCAVHATILCKVLISPLLHRMAEHVCERCMRVYPTGRLLELHILESHDTLFKLMAANQSMVNDTSLEGVLCLTMTMVFNDLCTK